MESPSLPGSPEIPESPADPASPESAPVPTILANFSSPAGRVSPDMLDCRCVGSHKDGFAHLLTCPAYEQGLVLVTETEEQEYRELLGSEDFTSVFNQFLCGRRQGKSNEDAYAAAIKHVEHVKLVAAEEVIPMNTSPNLEAPDDQTYDFRSPMKKRRMTQMTLGEFNMFGAQSPREVIEQPSLRAMREESYEDEVHRPLVTMTDVCNSLALFFAFLNQPAAYAKFVDGISECVRKEMRVNTALPSVEGETDELLWKEDNVSPVREFVRDLPEVEIMIAEQGSFRVEVGDFGLHVCFNYTFAELPSAHHSIMRLITFGVNGASTQIFDPKSSDVKLSFANLGNCVKDLRYGQIFIMGTQLSRDASASFKHHVQRHLYACGHTSGSLVDLGNGGRMALYGMRGAQPMTGQLQCRPQGVYIYLKPNDMSSILDGPLAKRDGNCAMCHMHRGCGLRRGVPDEAIYVPTENISWDYVFKYCERIGFPHCDTRKNVMVGGLSFLECFCLGLVNSYSQGPVVSQMTVKMNNFARLLTAKFHFDAPYKELESQRHNFTVVQVNRSVKCKMHVDGNNVGPSYICAFGDYTGGGTWIYDGVGPVEMTVSEPLRGFDFPVGSVIKGTLHDVRNKWVYFNGRVPHCTAPFTGRRYALVYFVHNCTGRLKEDSTRLLLESLGFAFPVDGFDYRVVSEEDLKNFDANPDIEDNQSDDTSVPNKKTPVPSESEPDLSDSEVELVGFKTKLDSDDIAMHAEKTENKADENMDKNEVHQEGEEPR